MCNSLFYTFTETLTFAPGVRFSLLCFVRAQLGFVDRVVAPGSTFSHAIASDVLKAVNKYAVTSACGDACVASPKEFYQLLTLFQPILSSVPETSAAFAAAVELLVSIGKYAAQKVPRGVGCSWSEDGFQTMHWVQCI